MIEYNDLAGGPVTKPFQGVRVVEVAAWTFVPTAGAILADLGADVIKIEPPSGDPQRGLQNALRPDDPTGANPFVEIPNRGKRSIIPRSRLACGAGHRSRPRPDRRRLPDELPRAGAPQARDRRRRRAEGERADRVRPRQWVGSSRAHG
jgi:formyl-CoA transferase